MVSIQRSIYWFNVLVAISQSIADVSYNQPQLSPCASWNPNAITVANSSMIGTIPYSIFVDTNNTMYIAERSKNRAQVWLEGAVAPTRNLTATLSAPAGIFATIVGDIYVDNGIHQNRVEMWSFNQPISTTVMNVSGRCYSLFVDINNTLYCCLGDSHQVVKRTLINNGSLLPTTVAGNSSHGSTANLLANPYGIFVDTDFTLYVADTGNSRIQRFRLGQLNGTTIVGGVSRIGFALKNPSGVILDADGYLFIVERGNHRIVGSGPNGFRCVAGCSGTNGSTADKLSSPFTITFDSYGNIFTTDTDNNRIQEFILTNGSCVPSSTELYTALSLSDIEQDFITVDSTSTTEPDENITASAEATSTDIPSSSYTSAIGPTTIAISESSSTGTPTSVTTTDVESTSKPSLSFTITTTKSTIFVVSPCSNSSLIGPHCNVSSEPCDILNPCQNAGTCYNNATAVHGYSCFCVNGTNGNTCQFDNRLCKSTTCWNNGFCMLLSSETFFCHCSSGWQGLHCEERINYCANITCLNNGICRSLFLDYKCECLTNSFSGRYCETKSTDLVTKEISSRTLAYVAILAICTVVLFIIVLDVLKYGFKVDPVRQVRPRPKPPVVQKFPYVN